MKGRGGGPLCGGGAMFAGSMGWPPYWWILSGWYGAMEEGGGGGAWKDPGGGM